MIGSIQGLISYAAARGVTITTEQAGVQLQKATDYMNLQSWVGELVDEDQEDAWPRILPGDVGQITDEKKSPINFGPNDENPVYIVSGTTPNKVVTCCYRLAVIAKTIDLMPSYGGPAVVEKRIEGALDIKYSEATLNSAPVFEWFDLLVGKWLSDDGVGFQFSVRRGL